MKTGFAKHPELSILLAAAMLGAAMLACSDASTPTPPTHPGTKTPASRLSVSHAAADCLKGIFPGTTTRAEVVAALGEPASSETSGDLETLLYASPVSGHFQSIVIQDQLVGLVTVVLDTDSPLAWSAVQAQYGDPAGDTYSNYLQGTLTYIYPDRGQTFVASPEADVVFIRECFVPMTLADYMNSWGKSLPTSDPFTK